MRGAPRRARLSRARVARRAGRRGPFARPRGSSDRGVIREDVAHRAAGRGAGGGTGLQAVRALARRRRRRLRVVPRRRLADLPPGACRTASRVRVGDLDDRCGCPQFSPDGRYLYFTCDDRGSECYDVYRYDVAAGRLGQPAAGHAGPRAAAGPRPLPGRHPAGDDGRARRRLRRRRDAGGAEPRRRAASGCLTEHPYTECSPRWSPGRRRCSPSPPARAARTRPSSSSTWSPARRAVVGGSDDVLRRPARLVAGRPPHRLLRRPGRPPGDRHLRARDRLRHLGLGGPPRRRAPPGVGAGRRGARLPRRRRRARPACCHIDLRDGAVTEYSIGPGNHYAPSFTPDGAALVCVLSRPDAPPDLYRVELDDGDVTALTDSLPEHLRDVPFVSGEPGLVHELGPPRRGARHPRRAGRAQRGRRRHRPRRPDLAPLQRVGPAAAGVRGRRPHRAAPQLPRQRRLRPPLAARQPLAHGPGRGARRGGRARVPRAAGLRPGAHRDHGSQLGRLPHHGRRHAVPRPLGGRRRRRALLRLHRQPARPDHPRGPALVGPREHRRHRAGPGAGSSTTRRSTTSAAWRRRSCSSAAPSTPAARRGRSRRSRRRCARRGRVCDYVVYPDEGHEISGLVHRVDYDRRTVEFILEHTGAPDDGAPAPPGARRRRAPRQRCEIR